jgi:hypothetical protein
MAVIVTLNGDIGLGYSIQPALNLHNAEVAHQWSVQIPHVYHHEFFHRPPPTGHFWQVILPPLPPHRQAVQAPVGSPYSAGQPPQKKQMKEAPVPAVPHFINSTPLCQLTETLPANANLITLSL